MKQMIRDRVIFIVISCIALAGMIYWCSATAPAVTLKAEYRAELGTQAAASFSNFFEEAQEWYDSYPAGENFTISLTEDVQPMVDLISTSDDFWMACEGVTDEALLSEIGEYVSPMAAFIVNVPYALLSILEVSGTYEVDAGIWELVGNDLDTLMAYYQELN